MNPASGAAVALTNEPSVGRIAVSGDWLQLRHARAEDAGRFRCQASNAHGQVEAEFQLDVVGKLAVNLEPRRQVTSILSENSVWLYNPATFMSFVSHESHEFKSF